MPPLERNGITFIGNAHKTGNRGTVIAPNFDTGILFDIGGFPYEGVDPPEGLHFEGITFRGNRKEWRGVLLHYRGSYHTFRRVSFVSAAAGKLKEGELGGRLPHGPPRRLAALP